MSGIHEETLRDPDAAAERAAQVIAEHARDAVAARGRFLFAASGGSTPRRMLQALANEDMPWAQVHVIQVDERVAPDGHAQRNLTQLEECLLGHAKVRPAAVHAMPVGDEDLAHAAATYAATLHAEAGDPAVLDLVHLGLGDDGHTASLVLNDAALETLGSDVAATGVYRGYRRLTLTLPALNRARAILWLVTGAAKGPALARLRRSDRDIPAGRVRREHALIVSDASASLAAGGL